MNQLTLDFSSVAKLPAFTEDERIGWLMDGYEKNVTPYSAWLARASFIVAGKATVDAVLSTGGDFMYYTVITPREIREVASLIGLDTALKHAGVSMFDRCSIVASVASVKDFTFDTDDLDCVKDIDPDADIENFDEMAEAIEG